MNPLPLLFSEWKRKAATNLLLVLLLAVALAGGFLLIQAERGLRHALARTAQDFDLLVGAPGSGAQLVLTGVFLQWNEALSLIDFHHFRTIRTDLRVREASPLVFADSYQGVPVVGVDAAFFRIRASSFAEGQVFSDDFEAVVGAAVELPLGGSFLSAHGRPADRGALELHEKAVYRVVGKLASTGTPWDRAILISYQTIWKIHHEKEGITAILVKPRSVADAYTLRTAWRTEATTAVFPGEVLAVFFGWTEAVKGFLEGISRAVLLLILIGVGLVLVSGIKARTRFLVLLRSLGAGRGFLFWIVWGEGVLLFTSAVVAGACFSMAGAGAIQGTVTAATGLVLPMAWDFDEVLLASGAWIAGCGGSLIPGFLAYRTRAAEGLRSAA